MKVSHFERLRPLCPRCLRDLSCESALEISYVAGEADGSIREGILACSLPACRSEYPIVDGIPIIVYQLRELLSGNLPALLARDDLSDPLASLIGDCCPTNSQHNALRQQLSSYASDHYGDLDPQRDANATAVPGATGRVLAAGLEAAGTPQAGPVIDVGCSVGRMSFALAEAVDDLVLGVDLNLGMLRLASRVLNEGRVRYPRRRVGICYDTREFDVVLAGSPRVDFWACDATALPFSAGSFALASSLNVLDCVNSPLEHLRSLAHILEPGARAIIATPYDWSSGATDIGAWLGGHSQRSEGRGSSEGVLRSLLAGGENPAAVGELRLVRELEALPWSVRMHDRSVVEYQVHLVVVERRAG